MYIKYLLVVLLLHGVLSDGADECVRYYFEDYEDLFTRERWCLAEDLLWNQGTYDNSKITALNEKGKWFIEAPPSGKWACTSSFLFPIMPNGIAEVNVYLNTIASDYFTIRLMQLTETGANRILGSSTLRGQTGWRVLRVTNNVAHAGNPPFQGYIVFDGHASGTSVMVVDSVRYVPSSMDPENQCILYEEDEDTTITWTDTPTTTPVPTTTPTTAIPTTTLTTSPITDPETTTDTIIPTTTTPITTSTTTTTITSTTTTPTTTLTTISTIDPATTPDTTPTTTPTTPTTTPDTTPTTTPTTPTTTRPTNLTNYLVEELVDFRKSIRISKKRITKVVNFNGVKPNVKPPLGLE